MPESRIEKALKEISSCQGLPPYPQRGWIADLDWKDVGPRFLEPIPDGKYKGFTIAKWLPDLVYEHSRLSGHPFKKTLNQLGWSGAKKQPNCNWGD